MISRIEVRGYRCLRYINRRMDRFHVLVGPNASGKTTFLDAIAFVGDLVTQGLESALSDRTRNFEDLTWNRSGDRFELAMEFDIPSDRHAKISDKRFQVFRYEIAIGKNPTTGEVEIQAERGLLKERSPTVAPQRDLFPKAILSPRTIITPPRKIGVRSVFAKTPGGNDNFYSEAYKEKGKGWVVAFKLGPQRSTLANLPADESKFPVATWVRELLAEGVQRLVLNSLLIRRASPPGQSRGFKPDGSNLPWVLQRLADSHPDRYSEWIAHLQTALRDVESVRTVERPDDRHRYLMIRYRGGLEVPSWVASDGTLRLLALTLPAYLPDVRGIYLIEEPENGIHPSAVESMFQSLSSVYDAQVLLATHSPVILSVAEIDQVLCFAKTPAGCTDLVLGREHPMLAEWRGETNLGVLFAGGVLG